MGLPDCRSNLLSHRNNTWCDDLVWIWILKESRKVPMMNTQQLQTLRCIDKFDKLGREGVVELLQKSEDESGANLMSWQAELIGKYLDCSNASNAIEAVKSWQTFAEKIRSRVELLTLLDAGEGYTLLDRIIDYPANTDNTWSDTARPKHVGYALDDILCAVQGRVFAPSSKCSFRALQNLFSKPV